MKKGIASIFIAAFIFFFSLYGFQEQQEQFPPEKYEVEVRLILVDVIVTKDGEFVKDLTQEDFELYEDGKKVPINSFELVSFEERELKILEEPEEKRSVLPKKKLAVIFDAINSWKREVKIESEKIVDQLFSLIKLGHEVMILQLDRRRGLEILQPFTTSEAFIRKAVEKASGTIWKLGYDIAEPIDETTRDFTPSRGTGGREDDRLVSDAEYYKNMTRLEYLYLEQQKFEKTIGGILASCNMLRNLPGRKSILLISAGIPDLSPGDMLPKIRSGIAGEEIERVRDDKLYASIQNMRVFDPFNILKGKTFRDGEEVIKEVIRYANAQNVSLYSLDSDIYVKNIYSGTTAEYYQQYQAEHLKTREQDKIRKVQNLAWLSEDTGAESLRGAKKFDQFLQVMSTDLTYYYQLSFYPQRPEADDKYHKLKVKVKRKGVDARFRKGYTDYSLEEFNKMLLITAYYNPSVFEQLPFKGEYVPFITKAGKYEPWMNIALPARDIFIERFIEHAPKIFDLHIWISDKRSGEKSFSGDIKLPFNINPSFMDFVKKVDYLTFHFKGPELPFKHNEYKAVLALVDPQTNEIGAWESSLAIPDFRKSKEAAVVNCVLGDLTQNPKPARKSFALSKQDGGLEYGPIKFYPKVTNQFFKQEKASVFAQIYLPQGKEDIQPEFIIRSEDKSIRYVPGELVAESWDKKSKIWSAIFSLDFNQATLGENIFRIEMAGTGEKVVSSREIELTILY
ncbi:MAG: VWA domain-containing protein [Candidatus Aminicenantes bacterium]|nr:VWA domain-containing protein [Candidatus Aminicenantes bacterium]